MSTILLIEDEDDLAFGVERALARGGLTDVVRARTGREALAAFDRHSIDVALVDLGLPDTDGLELLPRLQRADDHARLIMVTGRDDPRLAVRAIKAGAADYLVKPVDSEELVLAVRRALEEALLRRELESSRRARDLDGPSCIASSPAMQEVLSFLRAAAANASSPVLIGGESGTGKDVAASLVHRWSSRHDGPFVAVNAACLPASTLDSELFGHEAGAFTDAKVVRRGLFELAHRGTLFLDEIGELPLELQPKLLRVLEGLPFRRLGGEREIKTDVRVVAATNRDLVAMVQSGRFREDLYWRLKVLAVQLPPLRERTGDVRLLVTHFLGRQRAVDTHRAEITPEAMAALEAYSWPGNIRELRNVIERAQMLARGEAIQPRHLPPELRGDRREISRPPGPSTSTTPPPLPPADRTLEATIRSHVLAVWNESADNVTRAARTLGIGRVALRRRLVEYGVRAPDEANGVEG